MSIAPMLRVSLCGIAAEKSDVLDGLQALGVLHLIPLATPGPLALGDQAARRRAQTAYRFIAQAPEQKRPYGPKVAFDAEAVIGQIVANRGLQRRLSDRRDALRAHIAALEPWGDFTFPPPEQMAGQRLWFYIVPMKERAALERIALPWAIVGSDPTQLFVAVIAEEEPAADLLPVPRAHTGSRPLSALEAELEEVEIALDKAQGERAELTRWRLLLGANLAAAQDRDQLAVVSKQTLDSDGIFALEGWAPAEAAEQIKALAVEKGLALVLAEPGPEDQPPTLLRGPDQERGVDLDLTSFYTSPGYRTWDPNLVVFWSFALFFAMILADAGYALLIGLITLGFWRKMGRSPGGRGFRMLLTALTGASFIYGLLAGSFFGVAPPAGSWLARIAVIDVTDFQAMMLASLVVGALHIVMALGCAAWLKRQSAACLAPLGWIAVILGGGLWWQGAGGLHLAGMAALVAGLVAVFLGSALARPVETPKDWLLRIGSGLIGVTGVTKLFGDILSYLRLFALGLASASLAVTFNEMAAGIAKGQPGLGLLFALVVLLFGHAINFLIGIMSGVVHGLRLNYIEFFGWGLAEEGYPFRAFAKRRSPE